MSVADARRLSQQFACASDEEIVRAQQYRKSADRERFLTARTILRHALTGIVAGRISPARWRFCEGPNGKPKMAPDLPALEFNLSHADDCVAVAVSCNGPIGVDVESLTSCDGEELVYDALTERERAFMHQQPDAQLAFITYWTLKEACAKALGLGAAIDFRAIEIGLDPPRVLNCGVLGLGERIDVASMPIRRRDASYCLSVAMVTSQSGANPVWV